MFARLSSADIIVLATSIYFYSTSAQMKAVMDRLYTPKRKEFKVMSPALLAVGTMKVPNLFYSILAQYESYLSPSI